MRASLLLATLLVATALAGACRRAALPAPPPHAPQTSGSLTVPGLRAQVSVVRDGSGIPHISASNTSDLFFAQGFVQAQDRLFQMDLWRRASQGRLAEVLGSNFIERDAMTRRIRFRGHSEGEWAAYGAETHDIAEAFVAGINAWVRIARADLPEEFVLAGWMPEFWKPEDLLNRIDGFLAGGNALDELFRARLAGAIGVAKTDALLPLPGGLKTVIDAGVDVSAITFVVPDAVRRIGTAPFVSALAARVTDAPRPNAARLAQAATSADTHPDVATGRAPASADAPPNLIRAGATAVVSRGQAGTSGAQLVAAEFGTPDVPSRRYLVHLQAPGWNVIGATSPWLPGVALGHNERIAWAYVPSRVDTQDIYVEQFNPANPHQVRRGDRWVEMDVDIERIALKGREEPFEYERQYTSNGVVIAIDKERHLLYTLRWSGTEPGGAGELAALAVDRAQSVAAFQEALVRWKMPAAEFVYADLDGVLGRATAGLVPTRRSGNGAVPRAGWTGDGAWTGWMTPAVRAELLSAGMGAVSSDRLVDAAETRWVSGSAAAVDAASVWNDPIPHDVRAWVARLTSAEGLTPEADAVRAQLIASAGPIGHSTERDALLSAFVNAARWNLADRLVPNEFKQGVASGLRPEDDSVWSNNRSYVALAGRDERGAVLSKALIDASGRVAGLAQPTFVHPLAAFDTTKRRFNVGPIGLPGVSSLQLLSSNRMLTTLGLHLIPGDWNASIARSAPGQSGSPASAHYDDLGMDWSNNRNISLLYDQLDSSGAAETLMLEPRRPSK